MEVEVHLYATLAKYLPEGAANRACRLELAEGEGIAEILERLSIPEASVKLIFVNGVHAARGAGLSEGDRVGLFPPVGGG
jgi:molybdopterin converting factor small subunit